MLITGLFGYFVIGTPTLFIYYTLGYLGIPHFYTLILSFITSLLFISLYVSICNLLIQLKTPTSDEEEIRQRIRTIVEKYSEERVNDERLIERTKVLKEMLEQENNNQQ